MIKTNDQLNFVKVLAVFMFLYQTIMAVMKYIESPTIVIRTQEEWKDTPKPRNVDS